MLKFQLIFMIFVSFLAMSCRHTPIIPPPKVPHYLHIINLYSPVSAVNIEIGESNNILLKAQNLAVGESYPKTGYATVMTEEREFPYFYPYRAENAANSALITQDSTILNPEMPTTLILAKIANKLMAYKTWDNFRPLEINQSGLKLVDLCESNPASISFYSVDKTIQMPYLSYASYTQYIPQTSGKYVFQAFNDLTNSIIAQTDSIELQPSKNYIFYIFDDSNNMPTLKYEEAISP